MKLETKLATEAVRRMRGASQPYLMRCQDGGFYVVKFQNNPQHVRVLANEMLAARLGRLMGLPVPETHCIEVPGELIEHNPLLRVEIGPRSEPVQAGRHFGSRYPGQPGQTLVTDFLPGRLLCRVKNPTAFLGAFVFDKWTCNCDGRQVIFHRPAPGATTGDAASPGDAYTAALIDQGFCFNDGDWNFPDSPIRSFYPRPVVYQAVRGLKSFEPYLAAVENLETSDLEACARELPEEWYESKKSDLERLLERLYQRRRRVRQDIIDAKNSSKRPFPNWE